MATKKEDEERRKTDSSVRSRFPPFLDGNSQLSIADLDFEPDTYREERGRQSLLPFTYVLFPRQPPQKTKPHHQTKPKERERLTFPPPSFPLLLFIRFFTPSSPPPHPSPKTPLSLPAFVALKNLKPQPPTANVPPSSPPRHRRTTANPFLPSFPPDHKK